MLAIRMQRTGRKGHAMFRVIVQDSHLTPTSGKIVALLGSYDPHAKTTTLDKEKAATFLSNGAQPSDRAALLLKSEGVKLPSWVSVDAKKTGKLKNAEKLRRNRPAPAEPAASEAPAEAEEPAAPEVAEEVAIKETPETVAESEQPAEPTTEVAEKPADEPVKES